MNESGGADAEPALVDHPHRRLPPGVASVDVAGGFLTSTTGDRFQASAATRFAPGGPPIIPTDPVYPNLRAWNELVATGASYQAFLG